MNKLFTFLLLCFGISYGYAALFYFLNVPFSGIYAVIIGAGYMFLPLISVLITELVIFKSFNKEQLQISFKLNRWFILAIFLPPLVGFMAIGIALLLPGVQYDPSMSAMIEKFAATMTPEQLDQMNQSMAKLPFHPLWITVIQGIVAGLSINAVAAFGEEIGWRGFMVKEIQGMKFITAAIIIGTIWGLWHAPLILQGHNYPQHPQAGVIMMTAWCILLTFPFLYITLKSKSVIAAAFMHGTLNGTAGIGIMVLKGGNDLSVGVTGFAGFIALILCIIALGIYDYFISKEKVMFSLI